MFDEALKFEAAIIAARYEAIRTTHEAICHLAAVDDQEHDKVIEEFLMRISINTIIVEDNLHVVEKKTDVKQESLTEESHIKYVFNIIFEYARVQNSMSEKVDFFFMHNTEKSNNN